MSSASRHAHVRMSVVLRPECECWLLFAMAAPGRDMRQDRDSSDVRRPLWTLAVQSGCVEFETDMADLDSASPKTRIRRRGTGSVVAELVVRVLLREARWAKSVCWTVRRPCLLIRWTSRRWKRRSLCA